MKTIKKIANVLLVMVIALAMTFKVNAAETYTITIDNDAKGHTYEAYQIFAGDLHKGKLSNIKWGTGVTEEGKTKLGNAAERAESLTPENAEAFAEEVAPYLSDVFAVSTSRNETGKYIITGLEPGYYLIKDQSGSIAGGDAYTKYILEVVENIEIEPKSDVPKVEKKVDDKNDSTGSEDGENWKDSADYDIGDEVPFKLTGTLPANYADYEKYTYIFHDTMSKGLTYNGDAKVYVVNGDARTEITDKFTITSVVNDDGTTSLTISCKNLKEITAITATSKIVVEYTAILNENANIGSLGNPNEVYLEYSNNPNNGGEGDTGNTPEDKVIVFTFKTIINKVDGDEKPLAGAEFTLEKYNKAENIWKPVDSVKNEAGTTFTFTGLDDGFYRLTETKTPDGYNTIDPIYFVVTAEHDLESDDPKLTNLVVKLADENGNVLVDQKDGIFTIDLEQGSATTSIVNKSGAELPSTGGIGTTVFYVVGGGMMLVAAVLFVTKKKMENEK